MKEIDLTQPIRALSWKQPFADLMLCGKIETRFWDTKYRGLVLMCSSKTPYSTWDVSKIGGHTERIVNTLNCFYFPALPSGVAFAIGRLVDSRPMRLIDEEKCFVNFSSLRFCHVYEYVTLIEPFPWKGTQGWKILTDRWKQMIKPL